MSNCSRDSISNIRGGPVARARGTRGDRGHGRAEFARIARLVTRPRGLRIFNRIPKRGPRPRNPVREEPRGRHVLQEPSFQSRDNEKLSPPSPSPSPPLHPETRSTRASTIISGSLDNLGGELLRASRASLIAAEIQSRSHEAAGHANLLEMVNQCPGRNSILL